MWIYFRALLPQISKHFVRATIVATVLFIAFGLFLQWGFPDRNQKKLTVAEISLAQEKALQESFKRPEYQTKAGKQLAIVERRVYCSLMGSLCTNNPADQAKNFSASLFGNMTSLLIAPLTHPPASGIAYLRQSFRDAGLVTQAHAAEGIGFASLRPFLDVWRAFRNMAYIILVLLVIVIGFMIMFQYKIDSHTIISVQNALPRIVIALIVITFSYAIAGLLIDLTYIIILLIFQIFSMSGLPGMSAGELQNLYLTSNILSFGDAGTAANYSIPMYGKALVSIYLLLPLWLKIGLHSVFAVITAFLAMRLANNGIKVLQPLFGDLSISSSIVVAGGSLSVGDIAAGVMALLGGLEISAIIMFLFLVGIILIGILFLYFRIVFLLIGAYIQIVINVIFAPLFLLMETVPGQESFVGWLKKLFGNLMVFPTVIALILIIQVIQGVGISGGDASFSMPLLYGFKTGVLGMLITGAFMFAIPDIAKMVLTKIAGEPTIKGGAGLLFGGAGVLAGSALGAASQLHTLQRLTGSEGRLPGLGVIKRWFGINPKPIAAADDDGGNKHVEKHGP